MAGFTTPLRLELVHTDVWRLHEPLAYTCGALGCAITVPGDFTTDLASTPRWVPLTYALTAGTACAAAVVHDYLYQTHRSEAGPVSRAMADRIFAEAMSALGEPRWRIALLYSAVRLFGRRAYATGPARASALAALPARSQDSPPLSQ